MARALNSINKRRKQRLGNDTIYGSGVDGDVIVTPGTVTVLTEDMYYNNLTVNSSANLVTNGFRVFVKGTLINDGTIGLPAAYGGETGIGTLVGRVKDGTAGVPKSYVVGESASGTQVSAGALRNLDFVTRGWHIDPTDGFKRIEGADDGDAGADVAGSAGSSGTSGGSGTSGTAGGAASGGASTAGTAGTDGGDGTDGTDGSDGATGAGGDGGSGGGMVLIMAKTVIGTGTIRSDGSIGDTGVTGAAGSDGTNGTAGASGQAGTKGVDDLAELLHAYWEGGSPAGWVQCGGHEVCETITQEWFWVDPTVSWWPDRGGAIGQSVGVVDVQDMVAGQNYVALTQSEVIGSGRVAPQCTFVPDLCPVPAVPPQYNIAWRDRGYGQAEASVNYPGGAAGVAGLAGARGLGGAGGAGGIGETGDTGGEGCVFLITDSDDVDAGMIVGTYKTTIVN